MNTPLLSIEDLHLHFASARGVARVVQGVNLAVAKGSMHGLVGESGSGKSVTSRAVLGILPSGAVRLKEGRVRYDGRDLFELSEEQMRAEMRGRRISMVFQDPMTALNPAMRIGHQVAFPVRRHLGLSRQQAAAKALDLLEQVGIPRAAHRMRAYPHELSGGQRQRVMIAIALSCDPELIVADEPTTALDVTVQAQIMDLLDRLRAERGLSVLLVSHDLQLIAERCDEVSVMYAGRIVESGPAKQIFAGPHHPYSQLLEGARPQLDNEPHTVLRTIQGNPPPLTHLPPGCAFAERCPRAQDDCLEHIPAPRESGPGRSVSCFHPVALAPADGARTPQGVTQ
ncbi:ABC transporter ATP-binding protein [Streptomyces sp. NPDC058221]|uniref:ABC transporter ATP-binding protein n=1 Tax=Streptomyces sp. NPDC058221 TaxID=3346388 RepID=UPI0036EA4E4C